MPTKVPPIREFPKDSRIWRIDWLGAVERGAVDARIDVYLSPAAPDVQHPRKQGDFDGAAVQCVRIGIGLLPYLAIGSLWRNGRRLHRVAGYGKRLQDVRIGPTTVNQIEAGLVLSQDPKRWLIPHFAHQLPRLVLTGRTPCFAIECGGEPPRESRRPFGLSQAALA